MFTDLDVNDTRWPQLHELLAASRYTTAEVRRLLGVEQSVESMLGDIARFSLSHSRNHALRRTACGVLARLFLFNFEVAAWELAILPLPLFKLLGELNLVEHVRGDTDVVHGTVTITEYRQHYFVSDMLFEALPDGLVVHDDPRLCMPPHASSLELLNSLARPPGARSLLDVGCGTGCQSIIFGEQYEHVSGLDIESRSAMFAQINVRVNNSAAQYRAGGWETLSADMQVDHIIFNTPNPDMAFAFVSQRVGDIMSSQGSAHIWLRCEITAEDRDISGVIKRRLGGQRSLDIVAAVNGSSPFSLAPDHIQERSLPRHTLLVRNPAERNAYFDRLAERGVIEVASVVLTVRHRS